jgi:hypothetical protein
VGALSGADTVARYIQAKDFNRPHLLGAVFAADAVLEMTDPAATMSFPSRVRGLDAIADVLVRRFAQAYENIYTFCLCPPPADGTSLSCRFLVGMSEKDGGAVRVGCGTYAWSFSGASGRVERLAITIDRMETLPADLLPVVMDWLRGLPYPWCPVERAAASMPHVPGLSPLAR